MYPKEERENVALDSLYDIEYPIFYPEYGIQDSKWCPNDWDMFFKLTDKPTEFSIIAS